MELFKRYGKALLIVLFIILAALMAVIGWTVFRGLDLPDISNHTIPVTSAACIATDSAILRILGGMR